MKLTIHAETIALALAYQETLRVLAKHAAKDDSRKELFANYHKLVAPRLQSIYEDWRHW